MFSETEKGLFCAVHTPLHDLDARLKLLFCLLLTVLSFSASSWLQLSLPTLASAVLLWVCRSLSAKLWRVCLLLRWLLLFTLLLHLLFSSGRTLWGTTWLSLDGLIFGLMVCVQIVVAVFASSLLAMTTSAEVLARTFGWYLQPLQWLGVRVQQWQRLIMLSLQFLPVVHAEVKAVRVSSNDIQDADAEKVVNTSLLKGLLHRLIDRGDAVARGIVAGDAGCTELEPLPPLWPLSFADRLFSLIMITFLAVAWVVA